MSCRSAVIGAPSRCNERGDRLDRVPSTHCGLEPCSERLRQGEGGSSEARTAQRSWPCAVGERSSSALIVGDDPDHSDAKCFLDLCAVVGPFPNEHPPDLIRSQSERSEALGCGLQLLSDVELDDAEQLLKKYPGELSGGMRQRVLIAMALSADADILVADEPTTALDVSVQKTILTLLRNLQQGRNLALLLVTHDFGVVAEMADEVAVMYAGEIVEQSEVHRLFDQPAHPYTKALMACRPEMARKGEPLPMIGGQVPSPGSWPTGCHFAARCSYATDECRAQPIVLSDGDHRVRCIHPLG